MDKQILLLAARMLELASDSFSNRGCNDLDQETLSLITDGDALCKGIQKWNGDDDGYQSPDWISDWVLVEYLSHKLKEAANLT